MEHLIPTIYHEKQQSGSMLCAQHALNSLLQGNYFTAPDLAQIARGLDALEENYDYANRGDASTNMDDSGFFSIQVLENALHVWGLSLVRWRSEQMRPYHEHPHTQLAFILNLQQHWFTLRRFGPAAPDPAADPGAGHWFNLNSFLSEPEFVSHLYLGMVLQQAEQEGYSVFAVIQQDPHAPLALPRTAADDLAGTLPQPSSSASSTSTPLSTSREPPAALEGFEDEDMELQHALQASLQAGPDFFSQFSLPPPRLGSSSGSGTHTPTNAAVRNPITSRPQLPPVLPALDPEEGGDDPVAASMARNRAMLARMRREQEMALRAGYEEEAARVDAFAGRRRQRPQPQPQPQAEAEEDEEELLRRAILESQALAQVEGHGGGDGGSDDGDEEEMDVEEVHAPRLPTVSLPPSTSAGSHRVYDDDDAELQAALKASLESVPPGFVIPPSPGPHASTSITEPIAAVPWEREADLESEVGSEADVPSSDGPQEIKSVDVDEMRKRRLARFGG